MDLQVAYPSLASVGSALRGRLDDLAQQPATAEALLNFSAALWWVKTDQPKPANAADPYGYLATLDRLLAVFPEAEAPRQKLWTKLTNPNGSSFLDTVAEAATALHFRDKPLPVRLEVPFDAANSQSKDADVVLTIGGRQRWLDVIALDPQISVLAEDSAFALLSAAQLAILFADRIGRKYDRKFSAAVATATSERVRGRPACIVKYEQALLALLPGQLAGLPTPEPPDTLFRDHPGLDVAWIYTLRKAENCDLLRPVEQFRWLRQ